jgi:hypothetical protein
VADGSARTRRGRVRAQLSQAGRSLEEERVPLQAQDVVAIAQTLGGEDQQKRESGDEHREGATRAGVEEGWAAVSACRHAGHAHEDGQTGHEHDDNQRYGESLLHDVMRVARGSAANAVAPMWGNRRACNGLESASATSPSMGGDSGWLALQPHVGNCATRLLAANLARRDRQ